MKFDEKKKNYMHRLIINNNYFCVGTPNDRAVMEIMNSESKGNLNNFDGFEMLILATKIYNIVIEEHNSDGFFGGVMNYKIINVRK